MEGIFEKYNPAYDRNRRQAEYVLENGKLLTNTGHFDILHVRRYANPTPDMTYEKLLSLIKTYSYVGNSIYHHEVSSSDKITDIDECRRNSQRFEKDVKDIVQKFHGDGTFELPWITKAFILQPKRIASA